MDEFIDIYETMLGLREPEAQVPWVENAFEEGSLCAMEYEKMRAAYGDICKRLGTGDEDSDLEQVVASLEDIQEELCRQMLLLGIREHWRYC